MGPSAGAGSCGGATARKGRCLSLAAAVFPAEAGIPAIGVGLHAGPCGALTALCGALQSAWYRHFIDMLRPIAQWQRAFLAGFCLWP